MQTYMYAYLQLAANTKMHWTLPALPLLEDIPFHFHYSRKLLCQVHIVYLGHNRENHDDPLVTTESHVQLLASVFPSKEKAKEAILYNYKHAFSGFAATLDASQATVLKNTRGVISVFKSKTMQMHTTRSWDFMGLTLDHSQGTPPQLAYGDDIIVGVFDSGIWPESPSFKEEPRMGPIPKHWKGECVAGDEFHPKKHCNKKLIGARYYLKGFEKAFGKINKTRNKEYISPRDAVGHGTHTASTAVGSRAKDASFYGFASGVARGGAPRARLAVYKVCWNVDHEARCREEDVLAAFDDAICDGVHVISASIGISRPPLQEFSASKFDIGSFHAMQHGVSVIFSAGNSGPDPGLVTNVSPWSICVASSTMDRNFPTKILLEDNEGNRYLTGEGFVRNHVGGKLARARDYFDGGRCNAEDWNSSRPLSGMVLVCFVSDGALDCEDAGNAAYVGQAAALICVQPLTRPIATLSMIPVVCIDVIQGTKVYRSAGLNKTVRIFPSDTAFKGSPAAPVVSATSARGPSSISPDFLKPDISAPGSNVLAAWPPNIPPLISMFPDDDNSSVTWKFDSGTSMACPHVSGVVALVKSAHPNWSPAAIRSAIMTSAYNVDITGDTISVEGTTKSADPFDIGAGHINPVKALDPGLIYDMTASDYIVFLCNRNYTDEQIRALVMIDTCTRCPSRYEPNWNINYPSITVLDLKQETTVKRTVRNVGHKKTAIYFVSIVNPNGVAVQVWPEILIFSPFKEEITYFVTLKPLKNSQGRYNFGSITWSDGFHHVRSPLVVQVNNTMY
ncbi:subtilisin-like protease SBT3.18 [Henckelia pumila]|uniref:subtilisin-like protease SBT3.18 n=1 Tax=Henckelia pumila TaxID=405737 RepID=UPI003C6E0C2B